MRGWGRSAAALVAVVGLVFAGTSMSVASDPSTAPDSDETLACVPLLEFDGADTSDPLSSASGEPESHPAVDVSSSPSSEGIPTSDPTPADATEAESIIEEPAPEMAAEPAPEMAAEPAPEMAAEPAPEMAAEPAPESAAEAAAGAFASPSTDELEDVAVEDSASPPANAEESATFAPSPTPSPSSSSVDTPTPAPSLSASPSASSPTSGNLSPSDSPEASADPLQNDGVVLCPPAVTGLVAVPDDSSVTLSWNDVLNEVSRLVEHSDTEDFTPAEVVTDLRLVVRSLIDTEDVRNLPVDPASVSTRVSGLKNGVTYEATIWARGPGGEGPQSDAVRFVPTTGVEGEIGGLLVQGTGALEGEVPGADRVEGPALTDEGEALEGIDRVGLSEAVGLAEAQEMADALAADEQVAWAEPDLVVLPASDAAAGGEVEGGSADTPWNLTGAFGVGAVQDPRAGEGVTVAVIDTGVTDHPDLRSRLVPGYDFVTDSEVLAAVRSSGETPKPFDGDYVDGYGGLGRDADPRDPGDWRGVTPVRDSTWHGTHTAGVIADVVPGAKIQPIRALSWRGGLLSDVAAAVAWASGADVEGVPANATPSQVINLSFSVRAACPRTLQTAIDAATARGSVVVAAAGNANDDAAAYAPGNCSGVLTVGATGRDGRRASYSNHGAVVDVSAPGGALEADGGVVAASNDGATAPGSPISWAREGTSVAAAHTSAALAIVAARAPSAGADAWVNTLTGEHLRSFGGDACDAALDKTCGAGIVQIATSGPVPFSCEARLYQSATPGPRLYVYDPVTNTYSTVGPATAGGWNGMGYNTADDFIYGNDSTSKTLFRLDSAGTYETLGYLGTGYNSGDFWGPDRLLLASSNNNAWKSVDVSDPSNPVMTDFTLTGDRFGANAADFTVLGNTAYGLSPNGAGSGMTLSVINLTTQVVVNKTTSGARTSGGTGAAYADALGNVYFHVNGGSVYRILAAELSQPDPEVVSMGSPPTFGGSTLAPANDGASCPNAGSAFSATISNESSTVDDTSATVTADVNPNGVSTTATICYGPSSATSGGALQGCTTTSQAANASTASPLTGSTVTSLSAVSIAGLSSRTTYYWQVVTESSWTTTYGDVQTFTTTGAPITTTRAASAVSTTGATLNALVNPGNRSTTASFCFGTAADLTGCTTEVAAESPLSGTADTTVSAVLTGLTPGTTYYARASASNADGAMAGSIVSFTTSAVPLATLGTTTDVTSTDARLNATVDPKGLSTTVTFCYGTTPDLTGCSSATAAESPLVAASTTVAATADLTGLSPSTTYYVQVTASNANGSSTSAIGSFATSARPLVLTTTTGSLTMGTVGVSYAKTLSADGGTAPYAWSLAAGSLPSGLVLDGTTGAITGTPTFDGVSSFTVEVTDATSQSATKAFSITVVDTPTALTSAVTSLSTTTATLNGSVNPGNLLTTSDFCFGTAADLAGCSTITADESPLAASTSASSVRASLSGLTPGTTYYARVQATNSAGSDDGNIITFTTTSAPTVSTVAAIFRDKAGQAILTGSVNPKGLATTATFCWGTTPTLTSCTSVTADQSPLTAGSSAAYVSATVSGLTQGETHYFNLTATNSAGTRVGSTVEFTMPTLTAPSPTITSVSPSSGDSSGGTSVTITGTNFSTAGTGPTITIGGAAATVTAFNATTITATVPAGTPGLADVIVFNLDGQAVRATDAFTYTSAITYSVTYDGNGATSGSAPTDATAYEYGEEATIEAAGTLSRTGFTFSGWNTTREGAGTSFTAGSTWTVIEDLTLYAQWDAVASPALSAAVLSFGTATVGSGTAANRTFSLSNAGAATLQILASGLAVSGADAADFAVTGGSCSAGGVVTAFASCTITLSFEPLDAGARGAALSVVTDSGTVTAALSGTGALPEEDSSSGGESAGGGGAVAVESGGGGAAPSVEPVTPPLLSLEDSGAVLIDGVLMSLDITPPGVGGSTWNVAGPDFSMTFTPQPVAGSGQLVGATRGMRVPEGGWISVLGDGYQSGSSVKVYAVSRPRMRLALRSGAEAVFLGTGAVRTDGSFDIRVTLPPPVVAGDYVLQVNGLAPTSSLRSVNMALEVTPVPSELSVTTRTVTKAAFFKGRSVRFSKPGLGKLRSLVEQIPRNREDVKVSINAVSTQTGSVGKDLRLAAKRGRMLERFLVSRGVKGTYTVTVTTVRQVRSENQAPLVTSAKGKPLSTVRVEYQQQPRSSE